MAVRVMMQAMETPRARTLDAARMIAERYGVREQAAQLERAAPEQFEPLAVALLAEAVAVLLLESPAPSVRPKGRSGASGGGVAT